MTRFFMRMLTITAFAIPSVALAGDIEAGRAKYRELCVTCHGEGGKGDGVTGKALAAAGQPAPRDFTVGDFKFDTDKDGSAGSDADIINVVSNGALIYGGSTMMAPTPMLSEADLQNILSFIRSLKQ
ncbi:MAG: hypothetical protein CL908_03060 [Deltaproteobacteria bacterium]|nr:hypothetical protein [Deltaproteobacteria bacterium]